MDEVDWKSLCIDLFSLLDAIEKAARDSQWELDGVEQANKGEQLITLIMGRFQMFKAHGLEVQRLGMIIAEMH